MRDEEDTKIEAWRTREQTRRQKSGEVKKKSDKKRSKAKLTSAN